MLERRSEGGVERKWGLHESLVENGANNSYGSAHNNSRRPARQGYEGVPLQLTSDVGAAPGVFDERQEQLVHAVVPRAGIDLFKQEGGSFGLQIP